MKKPLYVLILLAFLTNVSFAGQLIIATTDYESGNTAVYDTETGVFNSAALGQSDQDISVDTDGEYVYFLSRSLGSITKYNPEDLTNGTAGDSMIWQYSVGPGTNPCDIVFLESKAYVIRYGSPEIMVVDQNAGDRESFELGTIDISSFDENGLPEAMHGFVHNGMVYVVIQRLNGWNADVPGYLLKIDPATDTIIDLDSGTDGVQGLELLVKNPQYFSQSGATAYISGHVWGAQTEGVQTVDLGDPTLAQSMILDEEELAMDITGVNVFDSALAIFYSSAWVQEGDNWVQVGAAYWFDPLTGDWGDSLPIPTPDGGAVKVDGILYVGSRDNSTPGVYPVDPATNELAGDVLSSSLPPTSMVYVSDDIITMVAEEETVPESFVLDAPHPNPFNPATTISFSLPAAGMMQVDVFNVAGQKVETLMDGYASAGKHAMTWNAAGVSNGVYFIRARHENAEQTMKVLLVK